MLPPRDVGETASVLPYLHDAQTCVLLDMYELWMCGDIHSDAVHSSYAQTLHPRNYYYTFLRSSTHECMHTPVLSSIQNLTRMRVHAWTSRTWFTTANTSLLIIQGMQPKKFSPSCTCRRIE